MEYDGVVVPEAVVVVATPRFVVHVNLSNLQSAISNQQCWCKEKWLVQLEDEQEEEDPHPVNAVKREECNLVCKM